MCGWEYNIKMCGWEYNIKMCLEEIGRGRGLD
jgi:hypothetical protein